MAEEVNLIAVDDDVLLLQVIDLVVSDLGWNVVTWSNTNKAIRAFQRRPEFYQGAIVDLLMPMQHDGITVARRFREKAPDIPIMFLSAYDRTQSKEVNDEIASMDRVLYVMKGLNHVELQRVIREFFAPKEV